MMAFRPLLCDLGAAGIGSWYWLRYHHQPVHRSPVLDHTSAELFLLCARAQVYRARIYTHKQAMKFVNALKEVDEDHEKDLADTTIDEALFDFPEYDLSTKNATSTS